MTLEPGRCGCAQSVHVHRDGHAAQVRADDNLRSLHASRTRELRPVNRDLDALDAIRRLYGALGILEDNPCCGRRRGVGECSRPAG